MKHFGTHGSAIAVILSLGALLGCQGVSAGKLSTTSSGPGQLSAAPVSVGFGNVQIGTSQSQSDTLTNTGGSNLTITGATVSGTGFTDTGLSLPLTLAPGQSVNLSVVFKPQSVGSASGNLALGNNGSGAMLNIALTGSGVAAGSLTTNPTSFSFANMQVGSSQTQTETLQNIGGTSLTVSAATATGAGFSITGLSLPLTLAPNQAYTFGVRFAPTSAGASNGNLSITVSGSNTSVDVSLSGTGVIPSTLAATPASVTFSSLQAGQTQTHTESIQNTGGTNATISQVTVTGTGFSISGPTTPVTLTPGQSASFSVTFSPHSSGSYSGSIAVSSNASNPNLSVALSGSATGSTQGQLSVIPTTINVGNVTVGTSGTQSGTLSASGAGVTVSSVSVGSTEFAVSGLSFPVTIAAGQSANFTVTFTPQASGTASVSASFASNASNSPTVTTLIGTGVPAPVHTVSLSWTASNSSGVTGYNIYRAVYGTACGSYSKINPVLNGTTTYTDTEVIDGTTYCYATTAVNSSNEESAYSNWVTATIPPP